jgi:HK97 family phage major capsid protein
MSQKLRELIAESVTLTKDTRRLMGQENRGAAENKKIDENHTRIGVVVEEIQRERAQVENERSMNRKAFELEDDLRKDGKNDDPKEQRKKIFRRYLIGGRNEVSQEEFRSMVFKGDNQRALSSDDVAAGGALIMPEEFLPELIKFIDNSFRLKDAVRTLPPTTADSYGVAELTADPDDAEMTPELGTGSDDSAMGFQKRRITPHPAAKRIKVSNELLRIAVMNPEALVNERLGYKFKAVQENKIINGSGALEPLGFMVASADGIDTDRDIATDNTAALIDFKNLMRAKHGLKEGYWPTATWQMHRDILSHIARITDGEDKFIWEPNTKIDDPETLLGKEIILSEYMPNTIAANAYVYMFGDLSHYWFGMSQEVVIQVLSELYAENNQTGYIGRMKFDGQPVLSEAFKRGKMGAA